MFEIPRLEDNQGSSPGVPANSYPSTYTIRMKTNKLSIFLLFVGLREVQ